MIHQDEKWITFFSSNNTNPDSMPSGEHQAATLVFEIGNHEVFDKLLPELAKQLETNTEYIIACNVSLQSKDYFVIPER